jgi:flavin reductase (NADH)/flavin reductase
VLKTGIAHNMTISPDLFKSAMRQLASGVCLVTTADADGRRSGLTATAVCSVSAEPPLLLVCVNQGNSSYGAIRDSACFTVNVLDVADLELAERFGGAVSGDARFERGAWTTQLTGAPSLASALAAFDCELVDMSDMGSHGVFFGRVVSVHLGAEGGGPLLYSAGRYGRLGNLSDI